MIGLNFAPDGGAAPRVKGTTLPAKGGRRRGVGASFAVIVLAMACGLSGCVWDSAANLTKADYNSLETPNVGEPTPPAPPIPPLRSIVAAPQMADGMNLRVSLSLTEDTPLRDAIIDLARRAGVAIEVDPFISGGLIFSAHNEPFIEVMQRLCDVAGLRYTFKNNVLRVERDLPYIETHSIPVINLLRRAGSAMTTSNDSFSGGGGSGSGTSGGSSGGNNLGGSSASLETEMTVNFWEELTLNLHQILANTEIEHPLIYPQVGLAPTPFDIAAMAYGQGGGYGSGGYGYGGGRGTASSFTFNRQAGTVTVFGNKRQQDRVTKYLEDLQERTQSQVLIDAKIVEVQLSDAYSAGINWRSLLGGEFNFAAPLGTIVAGAPFTTPTTAAAGALTLAFGNPTHGIDAIINLISTYGTVRTLSSPRLTVMNNEMGMLKVAQDQVFFQLQTTTTQPVSGSTIISTNSIPQSVPVGVMLSVQPSIDQATQRITLSLHPSVSSVTSFVQDPAVAISAAAAGASGVTNEIPQIEVREMDSVLNVANGQTIILGGLMTGGAQGNDSGIPGLMDVPIAGNLFKSHSTTNTRTELVIFLRASIIKGGADPYDIDLYRRFTKDPRPLGF